MDEHTAPGQSTPVPPPIPPPTAAGAVPPQPDAPRPVPPVLAREPQRASQGTASGAPPRQGRGGLFWLMVILLGGGGLVLLLFLLLGSMLGSLFGGGLPGGSMTATDHGPRLVEIIKEEGDSDERILVIPVEGIISSGPLESVGHSMVELLKHQLERAAEEDSIKAVILKVDSPGGEVLASDDMYQLLKSFQEKHRKPVIASMANLAASGGYYVSAPCRWIVANELTITGSIGVIMHGFNYRGLMDKVGIRPEVFKSGKFKDMLSGDKREEEISVEERAMVQRMVNETFQRFKHVVAEGRQNANKANAGEKDSEDRGRTLSASWADYADGRILTGKEALEHGFVDELGNFQTAVDRASQIAGLRSPEIVEFQPVLDFSQLFRLFGDTKARPVRVDLGLEKSKLRSGYMYFIWPMAVN